jgi:hypothetical protein
MDNRKGETMNQSESTKRLTTKVFRQRNDGSRLLTAAFDNEFDAIEFAQAAARSVVKEVTYIVKGNGGSTGYQGKL